MRTQLFVGAVLLAGAQLGLLAQQEPLSGAAAEVAAADSSWAECYQSCNVDGINRLIADDMVFIHINGSMQDKAAFVDSVRPCNMEQMHTTPTSIRLYGNTAIVIGNMTYKVKGGAAPGSIIYTRAYVRNGSGRWSLVTHQSTTPAQRRTARP